MSKMDAASLNADRRSADLRALSNEDTIDLLVIGGGVTGAGVALDAATRGLSVVLAEKHDLAFGTSRWSSKLVHGGLRYLASGNVRIAYESAVERGILISRTAPHLVRPLPQIVPLLSPFGMRNAAMIRFGYLAGDALRVAAGTPSRTLPRSRRVSAAEVRQYVPTVSGTRLRGGLMYWDGQLVDDARLVVALARTAARAGARVLTRCRADNVTGDGADLVDTLTGASYGVNAKMVINATGVWAGQVDTDIRLRPSRGTHLVISQEAFGGLHAGLMVPVPGETSRFVFALPADDHRVYVGLTDEEAPGEVPDVPQATDDEIDFLLDTISMMLRRRLTRSDVLGTFSGLRPLLDSGSGRTADVSRQHAVLTRADGLVSVVGGKLTTYRRMAESAIDAALRHRGLSAGPCRTRRYPLVGAANRARLGTVPAPLRLVRLYGTEATRVMEIGENDPGLLEPISHDIDTTMAELIFAVSHEGALDEDDLLQRRTRIALNVDDALAARPFAHEALALSGLENCAG